MDEVMREKLDQERRELGMPVEEPEIKNLDEDEEEDDVDDGDDDLDEDEDDEEEEEPGGVPER